MKREEALERFQEECREEKERLREAFQQEVCEQTEKLLDCILASLLEIKAQAEEQERKSMVFFHFALLRSSLLQNRAIIRLEACDIQSLLDPAPLCAECDLTFLFRKFFAWKEQLMKGIRSYRGNINRYDVESMMQEEMMNCNRYLAQYLRFAICGLEEKEAFRKMMDIPYYMIRWGEYHDHSDIVIQVNRQVRTQKEWLDSLEKSKEKQNELLFSYWYQGIFCGGDCRGKAMQFATFESCGLTDIDFSGANLNGARFLNCSLQHCDFTGANLSQAEFFMCNFEEISFKDAEMKLTVWGEEGFSPELLNESQLDHILLMRRKKETEEPENKQMCEETTGSVVKPGKQKYFFMDQDNTLMNSITLRDFDIHGNRHIFTKSDAEKVNDVTSLYLKENGGECAVDFLKSPVFMVSEMAKNVIDMYEDDLIFKKIVLIHKEQERELIYYHLLLEEISALDATTEYYPNGTEKRRILSLAKTGYHKAFLLKDSRVKLPVVSLEVAESLLRRHMTGVTLEEIEVR